MERYQVRAGSQSGHCCFDATVVDTTKPVIIHGEHYVADGEPQFEAMCECFAEADAMAICFGLNHACETSVAPDDPTS